MSPANSNEKRYFQGIAMRARERFPNASWHIADSQYSSEGLRRFVGGAEGQTVMDKRADEGIGGEDIYLDKAFRCNGNKEMCKLYRRRTACERMNSRAERLIGRNTLRGLERVQACVGMALTLMLLMASASYRLGSPGSQGT